MYMYTSMGCTCVMSPLYTRFTYLTHTSRYPVILTVSMCLTTLITRGLPGNHNHLIRVGRFYVTCLSCSKIM